VSAAGDPARTRALERVREIADELRALDVRLGEAPQTEVELSLFERAAELADEAVALLEEIGGTSR
jgi:hypothetical protein